MPHKNQLVVVSTTKVDSTDRSLTAACKFRDQFALNIADVILSFHCCSLRLPNSHTESCWQEEGYKEDQEVEADASTDGEQRNLLQRDGGQCLQPPAGPVRPDAKCWKRLQHHKSSRRQTRHFCWDRRGHCLCERRILCGASSKRSGIIIMCSRRGILHIFFNYHQYSICKLSKISISSVCTSNSSQTLSGINYYTFVIVNITNSCYKI